jgi:hypothetical protein
MPPALLSDRLTGVGAPLREAERDSVYRLLYYYYTQIVRVNQGMKGSGSFIRSYTFNRVSWILPNIRG